MALFKKYNIPVTIYDVINDVPIKRPMVYKAAIIKEDGDQYKIKIKQFKDTFLLPSCNAYHITTNGRGLVLLYFSKLQYQFCEEHWTVERNIAYTQDGKELKDEKGNIITSKEYKFNIDPIDFDVMNIMEEGIKENNAVIARKNWIQQYLMPGLTILAICFVVMYALNSMQKIHKAEVETMAQVSNEIVKAAVKIENATTTNREFVNTMRETAQQGG